MFQGIPQNVLESLNRDPVVTSILQTDPAGICGGLVNGNNPFKERIRKKKASIILMTILNEKLCAYVFISTSWSLAKEIGLFITLYYMECI